MKRARRVAHHSLRVMGVAILALVFVYAVVGGVAVMIFNHRHRSEAERPGVTFSIKYAEELNLDWRETYLALLNDLHVRRFRLMSYWDLGEPQPGVYKFDDLDWQMQQAADHGAKVTLAIGLRQPRWPECHEPAWATKLSADQQKQAVEKYVAVVVDRYKSSPALGTWQLENEALNTAFGQCHDFSRQRLDEEYALVKAHDSSHATIVNVSNEFGLPLGTPRPDVVGFSVYNRVYQPYAKFYFNYPLSPYWHGVRAAFIELFLHRPVIIHELQAEPWGPGPTEQLSLAEQNKSMDEKRVLGQVDFARRTGIKEYYLWGAEWWYWRKTKFNDPSLWEGVRPVFAGGQ